MKKNSGNTLYLLHCLLAGLVFFSFYSLSANAFWQKTPDKNCIELDQGECAHHRDGSPQKCVVNEEDGLCVEYRGECKCLAEPESCDEYEKLFTNETCYDCDGSQLSCPIGRVVTIDYGILAGQIYCCCVSKNVREVSNEEDPKVIKGGENTKAVP